MCVPTVSRKWQPRFLRLWSKLASLLFYLSPSLLFPHLPFLFCLESRLWMMFTTYGMTGDLVWWWYGVIAITWQTVFLFKFHCGMLSLSFLICLIHTVLSPTDIMTPSISTVLQTWPTFADPFVGTGMHVKYRDLGPLHEEAKWI